MWLRHVFAFLLSMVLREKMGPVIGKWAKEIKEEMDSEFELNYCDIEYARRQKNGKKVEDE